MVVSCFRSVDLSTPKIYLTTYQVFTGHAPYHYLNSVFDVLAAVRRGESPERPQDPPIADEHWGLIKSCWRSSSERPNIMTVRTKIQDFKMACSRPAPILGAPLSMSPSSSLSSRTDPSIHNAAPTSAPRRRNTAEDELAVLRKYNTIFIVDDSSSMHDENRWQQVRLSYIS